MPLENHKLEPQNRCVALTDTIITALKQVEGDRATEDVAREQGVSKHTIYAWKAKYWEPATRNRYQAAISVVFRVAVDNNKLALNPAVGIPRLREDNQTTRFLSPAEEEKLAAVVQARFPEYLPVLHLAIHTGTRTSELLRSQVGDYDADSGKLRVRQKKVRNSSAFRCVPLTPIAIAAYEKLSVGKKPGDLLCSKIKGGIYRTRGTGSTSA
jgi:integrase